MSADRIEHPRIEQWVSQKQHLIAGTEGEGTGEVIERCEKCLVSVTPGFSAIGMP